MFVVGKEKLINFWKKHPQARVPINKWLQIVEETAYVNFSDLKKSFPKADYVKPYTIFDIGGNKYRLVVRIEYNRGKNGVILVSEVMTHAKYDKWNKLRGV